tara:strand:- start:916 stop:2931 length:2016 start_codon:yes stop_codon:yes gene_type:complete
MKFFKYFSIIIFSLSYLLSCTIGVGWDFDGRPVLWKNRDQDLYTQNTVTYRDEGIYSYVRISTQGYSAPYMGINDAGFAIANSLVQSDDEINCQSDGNRTEITDESGLIREALESCDSIECFDSLVNSNLLESTYSSDCDTFDENSCTDNDNCYWIDEDSDCGNSGCVANHIQSNFAVIDSSGSAAIFEINTDSEEVLVDRQNLVQGNGPIFRSNHFQNLSNPSPHNALDQLGSNLDCQDLSPLDNEQHKHLIGTARRWCASEEYFDSENFSGQSIIKYLIQSDPDLNDDRGALLRSLTRSKPSSSSDIFYDLPYKYQASYACGEGRPSGYIYSKFSIARKTTTSSVVIKSLDDSLESFMLVAVGNPLFSPYIPIKVSDFHDHDNFNDYSDAFDQFSNDSELLHQEIFDYPSSSYYLDSQHLVPTSDAVQPNHEGIFKSISDIESSYIDFNQGQITGDFSSSISTVEYFYNTYINGFNHGGYDEPIFWAEINTQTDPDPNCVDHIGYDAKEFVSRIFHSDFGSPRTWKIKDSIGNSTTFSYPTNVFNPMIYKNDFIDLYKSALNRDIVELSYEYPNGSQVFYPTIASNLMRGCTNSNYPSYYDSSNTIDDGTCIPLIGDLNADQLLNILDILGLIYLVLDGEYSEDADINLDNVVNTLDIVLIINILLTNF